MKNNYFNIFFEGLIQSAAMKLILVAAVALTVALGTFLIMIIHKLYKMKKMTQTHHFFPLFFCLS